MKGGEDFVLKNCSNLEREVTVSDLLHRITLDPQQCGGRPCIRGMRIRVIDILNLFASGLTSEAILEEMPDLEPDDLKAVFFYAARRLDHPTLAA